MTKSWRPDNWDLDKIVDGVDEKHGIECNYVEAGADAILDSLLTENDNGKLLLRIISDEKGKTFVVKYPLKDAFLNGR